jgi:hypothetical protein
MSVAMLVAANSTGIRCSLSNPLICSTAMDHAEHVLIDGTSMRIRIARRIRGEVKVLTASLQISEHAAAACKTAA